MDKKLIGLLVAGALALTACGSGSGGKAENFALGNTTSSGSSGSDSSSDNSSDSSSSNSNSSGTSNSSSGSSSSSSDTVTTSGLLGFFTVDAKYGTHDVNKDSSPNYAVTTVNNINVLEIDNRKITLIPNGAAIGNDKFYYKQGSHFNGAGDKSWVMVGTHLKNARFGEMYTEGENRYFFYQGTNQTPESRMPTSGTAVYAGDATYRDGHKGGLATLPEKGKVNFNVNYGERTIYGSVKPVNANAFPETKLEGTIKGSTFTGQNREHLTTVNGAFYGNNAEELAGSFGRTIAIDDNGNNVSDSNYGLTEDQIKNLPLEQRTSITGTFGASKQ